MSSNVTCSVCKEWHGTYRKTRDVSGAPDITRELTTLQSVHMRLLEDLGFCGLGPQQCHLEKDAEGKFNFFSIQLHDLRTLRYLKICLMGAGKWRRRSSRWPGAGRYRNEGGGGFPRRVGGCLERLQE